MTTPKPPEPKINAPTHISIAWAFTFLVTVLGGGTVYTDLIARMARMEVFLEQICHEVGRAQTALDVPANRNCKLR